MIIAIGVVGGKGMHCKYASYVYRLLCDNIYIYIYMCACISVYIYIYNLCSCLKAAAYCVSACMPIFLFRTRSYVRDVRASLDRLFRR